MDVNNEELTKDLEEQYAMLEEEIQEDKKKKRYLFIFIFFLVMFLMIFGTTFSYYKLYEGTKVEEKQGLLKDLYIDGYEKAFDFDENIKSYYLTVKKGTTSVVVKYVLSNQDATVEITGNENLKVGINEVVVEVTDEDGNKKEYIIYVKVDGEEEKSNLELKDLSVSEHPLNEDFKSNKYVYTVDGITTNEDKIVINFELFDNSNNVKLKLNNSDITRKPQMSEGKYSIDLFVNSELLIGANKFEIIISDLDGNENRYTLILNVEKITSEVVQEVVQINVEYGNNDGTLIMDKIVPGWESPEKQHIKITNNSNYNVDVDINWTDVTNDFVNKNDLEYTLYKDNNVIQKNVLPSKDINMIKNLTINAHSENNYYITYRYIYSDKDQNIDQGKTFMAKLQVTLSK